MKRSKTDYRGGQAVVLSSKELELVATTQVGPRIVSFRSRGDRSDNLFFEFPADEARFHGFYLRGGHRLWHSPEQIPRTYQPDDLPLAVKELPNGVAMTQPMEEKTGLQKGMRIELLGDRTVKVTHTLRNASLWAVETAPWALTMLKPGGYGVLPLLPKGNHEAGDLLPSYALVPWTYTDLSKPVWRLNRDFVGIDVAQAREAHKLGITNYPGWSAYWLKGSTFVKYARVVAGGVYPDMGCSFETFTNGSVLEFETLGILGALAPAKTATHVESWTIFEGLKKPDNPAAFAKLAARVATWVRTLK